VSLKDNINYVKQEISTQESFMESFFKIEKFYKKYKSALIVAVSISIIGTIGYYVSNYISLQNKIEANKIFTQLLENPNNEEQLAILKEKNKKLYNIALFMQDSSATNEVEFLKELSLYSQAIKEQNSQKINTVTQSQDFLLKDFALFNNALILVQKQQYKEAKEIIKQIPENSNLRVLVEMLEHYLLTK
jgi:predicted negative regulator of RcsB-dependent stress response